MAEPLVFNPYTGWVDVPDPTSITSGTRLIAASDLLRYENFLTAVRDRINAHELTDLDLIPKVAALITELDAAEAVNASQATLIANLRTDLTAAEASLASLNRGVSVNSTSVTMSTANYAYIHTGAAATLTLPPIAGNTGVEFLVKNRGTASLTINAEANKMWGTSLATGIIIGIGTMARFYNDGTFWNVV